MRNAKLKNAVAYTRVGTKKVKQITKSKDNFLKLKSTPIKVGTKFQKCIPTKASAGKHQTDRLYANCIKMQN